MNEIDDLRFTGPLIDTKDTRGMYSYPETPASVQQQDFVRDFLLAYGNEY